MGSVGGRYRLADDCGDELRTLGEYLLLKVSRTHHVALLSLQPEVVAVVVGRGDLRDACHKGTEVLLFGSASQAHGAECMTMVGAPSADHLIALGIAAEYLCLLGDLQRCLDRFGTSRTEE